MRETRREPEVLEAEAKVGKWLDCCARITSKELAPLHSVKNGILQNECLFYKSEEGCRFGEKCSYAHRQVDKQPSKRSNKNGDKSAVAMLKITRQLGCVFQDMEPPKSTTILRKSSNILKPIRCVKFTKAVARHAKIRDQNPSRHFGSSRGHSWPGWSQWLASPLRRLRQRLPLVDGHPRRVGVGLLVPTLDDVAASLGTRLRK